MFFKKGLSRKSGAFLLIFLGWIVYATSYLGKVNYSANITPIIEFYNVTKAQAGTAPTFFFFAYGVGQVVNGLFCKKYNVKWMVFISLIVSAVINFTVASTSAFHIIKWLWLANGFSLSILWPSLVRLLSESLPKKSIGASSVVMGTTVATGTLVIYALSSLFVGIGNFKLSFYIPAFAIGAVAFLWLVVYKRVVTAAKNEKAQDENTQEEEQGKVSKKSDDKENSKLFIISVCILCFYAIGVNLIKDGLTTWVPAILKEELGVNDSLSILLTLFLPILAVFGNAYALKVHKKIPDYINHCAVIFSVSLVFIGVIIGSLSLRWALPMLCGLILVNFLASSLNSLVTSIYPMFMREKLNSGLFAGILNGFCYLGSTISSYGLGAVADDFGWSAVFYLLMSFCAVAVVIWCGYIIFKKKSV